MPSDTERLAALRAERERPKGPFERCHDCGARMMWSDPDAPAPSWMCPRCVYWRMRRAEEELARVSR